MPETKQVPEYQETTPHYPDITVKLVGTNGNAFAVLGNVKQALRRAGVPKERTDQFLEEAMSGDYNHLLGTAMKWVEVE